MKNLVSWTSLKFQKLCFSKDIVKRIKRQSTDRDKVFEKHILKSTCYPKLKNLKTQA